MTSRYVPSIRQSVNPARTYTSGQSFDKTHVLPCISGLFAHTPAVKKVLFLQKTHEQSSRSRLSRGGLRWAACSVVELEPMPTHYNTMSGRQLLPLVVNITSDTRTALVNVMPWSRCRLRGPRWSCCRPHRHHADDARADAQGGADSAPEGRVQKRNVVRIDTRRTQKASSR